MSRALRDAFFLSLLLSLAVRCLATLACPPACTCTPQEVQCRNSKNITEVPEALPANDTLHSLLIARTDIRVINASTFRNLRQLRRLDLNNNRIETLADGVFRDLAALETLILRRNFLRLLTDQTFIGLEGLKVLEMSWNCFVGLNAGWFQHLHNLEVLDLARNEIEYIQNGTFSGLSNLKVLNLTRNKLIVMSENSLSPLISLQILIVDDNAIRIIENETFSSLTALTRLSLTGNRDLKALQPDAFVSRSRTLPLEDLSLKGTHLTEVPVDILRTLPALKTLDLSQTAITALKKKSFIRQGQLLNLTIDSLPGLSRIEANAFAGLHSLETLVITNNRMLNNISWGVFRNLSSLKYLDLHNNGIETLLSDVADWQDIEVVDLRGNPFRCDCHAAWILTLLKDRFNTSSPVRKFTSSTGSREDVNCSSSSVGRTKEPVDVSTVAFTRQISCQMPPRLHKKCLASLPASEFRCRSGMEPRSKRDNADQRFKMGIISASITCLFLLSCALFLKFRRRVCAVCRRQYHYKAHRNRGMNGGSPNADIVELETTQLEDFESDDIDTSTKP